MKKENLILTLMFILMLVVSIGLIAVEALIPSTPVDKMFGQKVEIRNERPIIHETIVSTAEVYTLFGEKIADLYVTRTDNAYFYMELYVAIDKDQKVYAMDKFVNTYDDTSASYFPLVRSYILKNYHGLYYENVQFIDGAAGATTILVSRSEIKTAVENIITYHIGEPIDHLHLLFGGNYTLNGSTTVGDIQKSNVTFENEEYTVYQHTGADTYFDGSQTQTGEITILIAVDANDEIAYTLIPEDVYHHSKGNFIKATQTFLEGMVGMNLLIDEIPDSTTGPTVNANGSQYLVSKLVNEIKEVHNG